MSLAKRLQQDMTCISLLWLPVENARRVRFINQIVLHGESDEDCYGHPSSHLAMYLSAMKKIDAGISEFQQMCASFCQSDNHWKNIIIKSAAVPEYVRAFVTDTLTVATEGSTLDVASYFLFGREDAIPVMFSALLSQWQVNAEAIPAMK
ncbi:hypothetical protein CI610_01188 [invertebrate metagenome]|uniref:Uncharacterized protein n=1 Tax=invertebrate metagenome TaxID=1711999 RepID=A0A2H9T9D3_9ZZZZ